MATFTSSANVDDNFVGTDAAGDIFLFHVDHLNARDRIVGGNGPALDRLVFSDAGQIYAQLLTGVTGIEWIELANGTNRLTLTEQMGSTAEGRTVKITGGSGDDSISAFAFSADSHVDISSGAGNDSLLGGTGDDIFRFAAADLNQFDTVSGRGGFDRLILTTAGHIYGQFLNGVIGIEQIELANGTNLLALTGLMGRTAEDRTVKVIGNDGDDSVGAFAFSAADSVDISSGAGNDSLLGGAGDDIFRFAAADLDQFDTVSGRGGFDQLIFTTEGQIYGQFLNGVIGIEQVELTNGTNRLTLTGMMGRTAEDRTVKVIGGSGDDSISAFAFSADSHVDISSGAGNDSLLGGAGDDIFRFAAADLDQFDTVSGRGGFDRLVLTTAGQIYGQFLNGVIGIEQVELANGTNRLSLTELMSRTAEDRTVKVIGGSGDDAISAFAFSADSHVDISSGAGNDSLLGGAGDDIFRFAAADLNQFDTVTGRGGFDRLILTTAGQIYGQFLNGVIGIEQVELANGTNRLILTELMGRTAEDRTVKVIGGSGDDSISAFVFSAANHVDISSGAGNDSLLGGAGDDIFRFAVADLDQNDIVSGRGGLDRLVFTTAGQIYDQSLAGVTGIEQIQLANGANDLTLDDRLAKTAEGGTITVIGNDGADKVDASALSASNRVDIHAGLGNDRLVGGAGDDIFRFAAGALTAGDSIVGNDGYDRIQFTTAGKIQIGATPSASSAISWSAISSIEEIVFADGTNDIIIANIPYTWPGQFRITLGEGDNRLDASQNYMSLRIQAGSGIDRLTGGHGSNTFLFRMEDLTADDLVHGGSEFNTLQFTTAGHLAAAQWNADNRVQYIRLADGDNIVEVTQAMAPSDFTPVTIFADGDNGNDVITTTAEKTVIHVGGGNDILTGGSGYEQFIFAENTFDVRDRIDGGGNIDVITFIRSVNLTAADLANVRSIESIEFLDRYNGASSSIVVTDALVDTTQNRNILLEFLYDARVDASTLSSANSITVDSYYGTAHLVGGAGADRFNFAEEGQTSSPRSFLGDDIIVGGDGAAIDELWLYFGAEIDAAMLSGVSGIEEIYLRGYTYFYDWGSSWDVFESGHYSIEITDALASTAHDGHIRVQSDWGDDFLDASSLSAPYSVNLLSDGGTDRLIGGAGQDRLEGGGGFDTLTGGAGADIFAWYRPGDGNDIITDFTHGEDRLEFRLGGFDINGAAFDRLVQQSGSGLTNINDADLLLFAGTVTDAADLRAQLTATTTGADVGEGLFVAARTSDGHTHIFYTGDASGTTDESIYDMADLGAVIAPSAITLGDFAFV